MSAFNDTQNPALSGPKMPEVTYNLAYAGDQPPAIGSKVQVTMNGLGTGTAVGYFTECNFLGVIVELDNPPAWYTKQNGTHIAHVFGLEIK